MLLVITRVTNSRVLNEHYLYYGQGEDHREFWT